MNKRPFNYSHPVYLAARREALSRDKEMCVFCGESKAEETIIEP